MTCRNARYKEDRMTQVICLQNCIVVDKTDNRENVNSLQSEKNTSERLYYRLWKGLKEGAVQKLNL